MSWTTLRVRPGVADRVTMFLGDAAQLLPLVASVPVVRRRRWRVVAEDTEDD